MVRKKNLQFALLSVLTFSMHSCRTEDEVLPKEEQSQFRVPIEMFLKFEEKAQSDPEFRAQNKQETGQVTQKNGTYNTTVNIPISQVSYKLPFRETIESFFQNNPALGLEFYKDFGNPFYNVSTYTYGDSSKAIAFPILQGDRVTAFIHGIVTPNRDYVQFTIVQNNDPVTLRVLAILQDAVDNLYPKNPTPMGKFAKEQNIRINDIEEITIIKFNVFSGGGGGFGYMFPGREWWKDSPWKEANGAHLGSGGGKAMSGDGSKHKFPDYLDPNDNPCVKLSEKNEAAKAISGNSDFKNKKTTVTNGITNSGPEKGYIFGKDTSGNIKIGDVKTGTDSNVSLPATDPNFTVTGSAHTHTGIDSFDSFSPLDFYATGNNLQTNANYSMMFVFGATGEEYVLNIIDPIKIKNFMNLYKQSTNIDESNGWMKQSALGENFYNALKQFIKQGKTDDEAYVLANAYVLRKYDTGMVISKKDPVGRFNTLFVKEVKNSSNANETNYEQTDNCNL
ncbi:hypothetical protein [Chryseobacterium sp. MYb328]|uniref:hypothetical protein n=1 Tax=Chryseobacterium sp. MYb328 TaxID=2745231 RepID=UPI00309CC825